jgi:cytochrome P450
MGSGAARRAGQSIQYRHGKKAATRQAAAGSQFQGIFEASGTDRPRLATLLTSGFITGPASVFYSPIERKVSMLTHVTPELTLDDAVTAYFSRTEETLADPYPTFKRLRADAPVYRVRPDDPTGYYVLTRYADCAFVAGDPRFLSNRAKFASRQLANDLRPEPDRTYARSVAQASASWILNLDAPDHSRLRGLASKAFTSRTVTLMRERIQRLVDDLLDAVAPSGQMDVIANLASPLPVIVISELLGVPVDDHDRIRQWSRDLALVFDGLREPGVVYRAFEAFDAYLTGIIAARRLQPGDDLLSQFIGAEEQGDRLTREEMIAMCVLLLVAGHETTTHLIGNGVLALLRHPEQLARLREEPSRIGPAVEEMLRYDSPVQYIGRVASEAQDLSGTRILAGETVQLWSGAANRDPEQFLDPDTFDITRSENRHMSFSRGPHFCLGAALARMEAQIAIGTMLRRLPNLRLAPGKLEQRNHLNIRGVVALPVTFTPRG